MSCGKQTNREFFDEIAPIWDSIVEVAPEKIRHILDVCNLHEGSDVLDVGTGTGVLIPYIEEKVTAKGHIDAIDISPEMLKIAASKNSEYSNVDFINIDVERDILETQYDCITMYCMYPHLELPLDTLKWLARANLKKGGTIVIAFPESRMAINGIHRHNDGSVHSDKLMPGDRFAETLAAAGLRTDYIEDNADYYIVRIACD